MEAEADRSRREVLPGVVHVPAWLGLPAQRALVEDFRRWALPPAGLRHPRVPTGHLMSVQSVCLGWHWQPYAYSRTADDTDGARVKPLPPEVIELARDAVGTAYGAGGPEAATYAPDAAIVNLYAPGAHLGLHQQRLDEQHDRSLPWLAERHGQHVGDQEQNQDRAVAVRRRQGAEDPPNRPRSDARTSIVVVIDRGSALRSLTPSAGPSCADTFRAAGPVLLAGASRSGEGAHWFLFFVQPVPLFPALSTAYPCRIATPPPPPRCSCGRSHFASRPLCSRADQCARCFHPPHGANINRMG